MLTIRPQITVRFRLHLLLTFLLALASHGYAATSNLCDRAAYSAAQETGVPLAVLKAVTRTETGRSQRGRLSPWPWAINVAGKGLWPDTRQDAERYVRDHLSTGKNNIDVGCFQLNYRWHGNAFGSVAEMFDPFNNAQYAAQFLSDLYKEKGNWTAAVGAFHSRTPEHATRYQKRFNEIFASMSVPDLQRRAINWSRRKQNRFPLLQNSGARPLPGSLVPLSANSGVASLIQNTGKN
ncbi:transglycosylase SLT domain-containing protein [Roseobacter sp. YSTF-M11]|uniref:Transglycosylase SLT domain-containing protein n=1 Tax=Roseobacter insulae TaxID=2859783 RepID=A0A9X1FSN9_9RHOB|nr:transglycosylase SLT domain-containing protein [Roseobacter insulae]MBW4706985.1 transglycosylase SLT domain-containing protein [Roseobacter insulae]